MASAKINTYQSEYREPTVREKERVVSEWEQYFKDQVVDSTKGLRLCYIYGSICVLMLVLSATCVTTHLPGAIVCALIGCGFMAGIFSIINSLNAEKSTLKDLQQFNFMVRDVVARDFRIEQKAKISEEFLVDTAYVDVADHHGQLLSESVMLPIECAAELIKNGIPYQFPVLLIRVDGHNQLIAISK